MFSDNLVSKIILFYLKLAFYVLIIYAVVNVVAGINWFNNMYNLSKIVQENTAHNGYLTWHDEKEIRKLIEIYEKPNKMKIDGPTILGLNKVVRNIRIYIYDPNKMVGGEFPEEMGENTENPFAQVSSTRLRYRKQQGEILYAGITFDYYIIMPFGFWKTSTGGFTTISRKVEDNLNYGGTGDQQIWDVNADTIRQKYDGNGDIIVSDTGTLNIDDALTTGGMIQGKLGDKDIYPNAEGKIKVYISPIACSRYYADLESTSGYAGDD